MGAQPVFHLQHMRELQFTGSAAGLEHGQQQMWSQGDRSASAVLEVQTWGQVPQHLPNNQATCVHLSASLWEGRSR